jgi:hypothetical protein
MPLRLVTGGSRSVCHRMATAIDDPTAPDLPCVQMPSGRPGYLCPLLAYALHTYGKSSAGGPPAPGDRGHRDLRISRARPRRPEAHGATRPVRRGSRQGTKVERRESAVGESHRRRVGPRPQDGPRRDPRIPGASPAAREGRTSHEEPTYDRDEPVRDVRRSPAECRLLPGLRPFLLLVGVLHAAPRAAFEAPRATRVLPQRLPVRREARSGGRPGVRPLNRSATAEGGRPANRWRAGTSRE